MYVCVLVKFDHTLLKGSSWVLSSDWLQGAHLALIDSLMSLAAMETVSVVKMAKEAEQFGDGAIWENSLLFWINKVNLEP